MYLKTYLKKYGETFVDDLKTMFLDGDISNIDISIKYGVSIGTVSNWKKTFRHKEQPENPEMIKILNSDRILKKHGDSLLGELLELKSNPFKTLESVGVKFGLTRERIRQLYNSLHYPETYSGRVTVKNLVANDIRGTCILHPKQKAAEMTGNIGMGAKYESLFWSKCEKLNYDVSVYHNQKIDMRVNGFAVDVKSSEKTYNPNNSEEYHHYSVSEYQMLNTNFISCYHHTRGGFIIIPTPELLTRYKGDGAYFININTKQYSSKKKLSRYHEYYNRFDLLAHPNTNYVEWITEQAAL